MNQRFSYSVSQLKSVNQQISESTNQWFNNSEIGLLTAHGPTGTWAREQSTGTRTHGHTGNPRAHGHPGTRRHMETHGDTAKSRAHGHTGNRRAHEQSTSNPRAHGHTGTRARAHSQSSTGTNNKATTWSCNKKQRRTNTKVYNDGQGAHNAAMTSRCGNRLTQRQTDGQTNR